MSDNLFDRLQILAQPYSLQDLKKAYTSISQAYRQHTSYKIRTDLEACAYALARMPATFSVLQEILNPVQGVHRVLDLGCGPGSLLWAGNWDLEAATLVDRSGPLIDLGKKLSPQSYNWVQDNILIYQPTGTYDLVAASYVLNELSEPQQATLLETAWKASDQYLVLVEPGTPVGFANIKRARQFLIQQGAFILSPCTHENPCPMSQEDWCHFSVRVPRSPLHKSIKGTLDYEDEKYSYIIATKQKHREDGRGRIVKKPLKSKGLVQLDVCAAEGLERKKISKSQGELYKQAKAYTWGDEFI